MADRFVTDLSVGEWCGSNLLRRQLSFGSFAGWDSFDTQCKHSGQSVFRDNEHSDPFVHHWRKQYNAGYTYNVAGQPTGFTSRDLSWQLSYDKLPVPSGNARAKYDGNISCLRWKNGNGTFRAYTYQYDGLGQLLQADYNEQSGNTWSNPSGKYNVGNLSYDANGNLQTLIRKNASGGDLHNLIYQYNVSGNGNAIGKITLNGQSSGNYAYDANGNMLTEGQRGYQVVYNDLNLPAEIRKGSEKISYIYSASGKKLAMQKGSSLTYYRGVIVYNGNSVSYLLHPEGLIQRSSNGWVYNYRLTDHSGSTRVLLEGSDNGLTTVQTNEYYPFGLSFAYNNLNRNKYLFSGKEYQDGLIGGEMLGLYDFGARYYNPLLGRWFGQDPALQLVTPYGYCGNNPVAYIDPDGEWIHIVIGALLGGVINVAAHWNQLDNFWDGMAAFGIGSVAGALGAATGGAAFAAAGGAAAGAGGAAAGAGGFMAGAVGGTVGSASMMSAQSLGNSLYFDDPLPSAAEYALGIVSSAMIGGTMNGVTALFRGKTFWTGSVRSVNLPAPQLISTKLSVETPKAELVQQSPRSLAGEIPGANSSTAVIEEASLPAPGRVMTLDTEVSGKIRELYNFSDKAILHMNEAGRKVPVMILDEVIKNPMAVAKDIQGSKALFYYSQMWRNGNLYNIEVLYNRSTNSIWHFKYTNDLLGPLPLIK